MRNKGLLVNEEERKVRTLWVTSNSSTIEVTNILQDLLGEAGGIAGLPCETCTLLLLSVWEGHDGNFGAPCLPWAQRCSLPPVASPNSLRNSCSSWLQVVDGWWG